MASKVRAHILHAAEDQFAAHGYAGASTKLIAYAADVHESSLFRLFGSKEQLFSETFDAMLLRRLSPARFIPCFDRPGWKPPVLEFARTMHKAWSPRGTRLLLFATLERPETYTLIAERWKATLFPLLQHVQRCQTSGLVRPGNASRMTEAIGDAIFVWYLLPMISDAQRKALRLPPKDSGGLLETFLDGMRARKK